MNNEILRTLYEQAGREITRYRDYEWKITAYIGAIFIWIISMSLNKVIINDYSSFAEKLLWTCFLIALYAFGVISLIYVHARLNKTRNLKRKIEHIFGLFEKNAFSPQGFSVPETQGWNNSDFAAFFSSGDGKKIKGFFEGTGFLFIFCFFLFITILVIYSNIVIWVYHP